MEGRDEVTRRLATGAAPRPGQGIQGQFHFRLDIALAAMPVPIDILSDLVLYFPCRSMDDRIASHRIVRTPASRGCLSFDYRKPDMPPDKMSVSLNGVSVPGCRRSDVSDSLLQCMG
ncbi:hypothetical protein BD779DRAFT_1559926 [Infundibulicybe gibba]|nr:hypothetical protein BD779DRAFT_1559926 [Infundibulicybe gibba]